jgi:hypothetical protein
MGLEKLEVVGELSPSFVATFINENAESAEEGGNNKYYTESEESEETKESEDNK